jgi:hypothetical protein
MFSKPSVDSLQKELSRLEGELRDRVEEVKVSKVQASRFYLHKTYRFYWRFFSEFDDQVNENR